jgi:hygromycin-B 4-O-kinase
VVAEQLSREDVVAFLGGQPEDLEPLSGGGWSSAWAYRAGGEELVVRFGPEASWYEADRMAMAFAGPDLPVPEVREVGTVPSGRAYAISVRHHGRFLEDTPVWREFLLGGLADDPGKVVRGWSAALAADPELAALSAAVAGRVEAVLSWKCSVRGDFLFDAAWCSFWAPWHPGTAAADPLSGLLEAPAVRAEPAALLDAAARHHCYELHIGFTHLGWNIWTGNQPELAATARRLAEILERGPLPLIFNL